MEKIWETHSPAETAALGKEMGKNAQRGQIFCLTGDLGTGKTVFTKGFAAGLGVTDHVTSPTFTIVNEYEGKIPLFHFDLYRLGDEEELWDIGWEDYLGRGGVCAVEWSESFPGAIPPEAVTVTIRRCPENEDWRRITVEGVSLK